MLHSIRVSYNILNRLNQIGNVGIHTLDQDLRALGRLLGLLGLGRLLALRLCARTLKSHLNKIERKNKTHAKFEIVQEILPDMAKKAADHLGRPVPSLDRTITRIMNVGWIEPSVKKDGKQKRTFTYKVYNYTSIPRTFRLHAHLPKECIKDLSIYSSPFFLDINEEGKANWEIRDIQPSANVTVPQREKPPAPREYSQMRTLPIRTSARSESAEVCSAGIYSYFVA